MISGVISQSAMKNPSKRSATIILENKSSLKNKPTCDESEGLILDKYHEVRVAEFTPDEVPHSWENQAKLRRKSSHQGSCACILM
ncbi:unnamed protein product [Blepharisma stoltei]|uniref:Uncharacterized protein n=1 Tax=Blepharisma stoltei TaxID=1481888 RepID=A0AAU9IXW5_9CILI|nr:unnamed protein product [Blepharisma stoltei]